jgi:hypothetical protein
MSPLRPNNPNKPLVWLAAVCVGMDWFLLATFTLLFVLVLVAVMFGLLPMHISVSRLTAHVFLVCLACFVLFGFIYLVAALSLTCPYCGFKFLKNPKGMGPAGFVYHQDCPKRAGPQSLGNSDRSVSCERKNPLCQLRPRSLRRVVRSCQNHSGNILSIRPDSQ